MLIGYARVSTNEQNLDLQIKSLKEIGCKKIYTEKASGSRQDRPELKKALDDLREEDTLVVWKLDRLARSVKHLVDIVTDLHTRKVDFKSVTDSIDTSTPSGRFFFHVMSALAQMERELIVERTKAGLDAARSAGRLGGRRRVMTDSKLEAAKRLLRSGHTPKDVSRDLNISIPTLYRWLPAKKYNDLHEI